MSWGLASRPRGPSPLRGWFRVMSPGHTQLGRSAPAPHCPWKTSPSSVRSTRAPPSPTSKPPAPHAGTSSPIHYPQTHLPPPSSRPAIPAPCPASASQEARGPGGPRAPPRLGTKALRPPPPHSEWSLLKRHVLTALVCLLRHNRAWSHSTPTSPGLCGSRPRNCFHTGHLPNMSAASPGTSYSPRRLAGGSIFHDNIKA